MSEQFGMPVGNINEDKPRGYGAIIGAIIIIAILALGAWYFISNRIEKIEETKVPAQVGDVVTGDSTEVEDIQTDLENINLDVLDEKL